MATALRNPKTRSPEVPKLLLEAAPFALILVDPEGRIEFANARVIEMLGFAPSELVGKKVESLMPERVRHAHAAFRSTYMEAPTPRPMGHGRDLYGLRKDGTEVPLEISLIPFQTEQGIRVLVTLIDITARKSAEQNLIRALDAERNTRTALEKKTWEATLLGDLAKDLSQSTSSRAVCAALSQTIVPALADWCFLAVFDRHRNLRLTSVTHRDPEKQRLAKILEEWTPDPDSPEGVAQALRTGRAVIHSGIGSEAIGSWKRYATFFPTRDPNYLRTIQELGVKSYMALPLVTRDEAIGVLVFVSGTTSNGYGEHRQLIEEVVRRGALTLDNSMLFEETQRAVRVREEFITVASHELRTPLTSLKMQLDLLGRLVERDQIGEIPMENLKLLIEGSGREIERFTRLVEILLDVSKIGSGKVELKKEQVDLSEMVRSVCASYESELKAANCQVSVHLSDGATGAWDRLRLSQVVTNLLSNALKYGRDGPIEITTTASEENVRLSIKDFGPGIAKKDQGRIFNRFERAADSRRYGGLGLGLYISRELVEAHGGRIWVESEEGSGSTFFIELPRRVSSAAL